MLKKHALAQYYLGVMYKNGSGLTKDETKAFEWFAKAAEQGLPYAQNSLALMYQKGQGVEENLKKAVEWYTKFAEQGHARARINLAVMYKKRLGVAKNDKTAKLFTQAAEKGMRLLSII